MYRQVPPVDRKMMQKINQNTLLNLIRVHAPISRTELRRLSGLSQGTIFGMTASLIEQQLIVETGETQSTGGRKAELLEIYPEGGYVLGLEIREYELVIVLLNLHGNIVAIEHYEAQFRSNAAYAVDWITGSVDAFITRTQVPREKLLGIGCGISGCVNTQLGEVVDSWILDWHNVTVGPPLQEHFGIPVFVDNSVNCLICYERLFRSGQMYHNFLLVTFGRGLGMAAIIRDSPFRGSQGLGAEFGHIPFNANGRFCECGNQGCLEAYVSDHGILRTYAEIVAAGPSHSDTASVSEVDQLVELALQGNEDALQAFALTGTYLGNGLACLINLFNPECLIICNEGEHLLSLLSPSMETALKQHTFSQLGKDLQLICEKNTTIESWARGAGCLVLQDFFASPKQF
ncbi:ROK family protein [Dictyobacter formicarum]|uniref:Xylose repressor protein n=1 Tax=Dictyobacter formicarum TaxID=2778368 RepID=A0ABQ3VIW0_9CHLR|nr:ROK family protein [Dictyobacter formicarum]GHO86142.1 xylose repressor protein [Dictyobacter formicarum]